jgi:hypothetical protein
MRLLPDSSDSLKYTGAWSNINRLSFVKKLWFLFRRFINFDSVNYLL